MSRALDRLYRILVSVVAGLLAVLTVVVSYQAFSRYIPLLPRLLWTEEAARFCFIWMVLLGAAIAVRAGTHFTIDVLPADMTPRVRRVVEIVTLSLVMLAVAILFVGGLRFTWLGRGRVSTTSGVPLAWVYAAFPVASLAMLAFAAERMLAIVRGDTEPPASADRSGRPADVDTGVAAGGE